MSKKRTTATPTQRTMDQLRKEGWMIGIVEKWNHFAKIRQDLFGFIDLVAVKNERTIGVQACNDVDVSPRVNKILDLETANNWLAGGTREIQVWGWRKRGDRGEQKFWAARVQPIVLMNGLLYCPAPFFVGVKIPFSSRAKPTVQEHAD
jgi:hypothetical protein